MRLIRVLFCAAALICLLATPTYARQRGSHPMPHPPAHTSAPAAHAGGSSPHTSPTATPKTITINPALASRLQPLLPAGTSVESAAAGFRNQGQFVAAVHVSHNLNIPFAQLKTEMTGPDHDSLGQAIQELRPSADSKTAVTIAERQEREDVEKTKSMKTGKDHR